MHRQMADLKDLRFLIIDDNEHMRKLYVGLLRIYGATNFSMASDGQQALDALELSYIDIIVTNWQMRPIDGIDLVRRLRASPHKKNNKTPIIMVTANTNEPDVKAMRDVGVDELLAKPISAHSLYRRVEEVIFSARHFIENETFAGPCRRRVLDNHYHGLFKRWDDQAAGTPEGEDS